MDLSSVRQLADQSGAVTLAQAYEPYGSLSAAAGSGSSVYGFTGEQQDTTGLVYLRARYYDGITGRFLMRDQWKGDPTAPTTLNAWLYVSDDPANYTDPSGRWRWRLPGNPYHLLIEQYYETSPANPAKQLEYPIPGTPFRHPDMFNSISGDIYEIEPWFLEPAGIAQVLGYQADLLAAGRMGRLHGAYFAVPFDWNSTPFHVGTGVDWPGKMKFPLPNFPAVSLVADYVGGGTVAYWIEPNALAFLGALPFIVPNKRLVRPPIWIPGRFAPQPALAVSVLEACGYGLIMVGGTILVVTIAEDFATLGVGGFDDVVTVPAGLLFINLGQRVAVLVPVSGP